MEEWEKRVDTNLVNAWRKLSTGTYRRFFEEDPELIDIMKRAYIRIAERVTSHGWFDLGCMQNGVDYIQYIETLMVTRPRVIIETGTAAGATTCFFSEILERIHGDKNYLVITVEYLSGPEHMVEKLKNDPNIISIIGDSSDPKVVSKIKKLIPADWPVMVTLDSNHSCYHVMAELSAYKDIVSPGQYLIVQDTYLGLYFGGNVTQDQMLACLAGDKTGLQYDYITSPLGSVEAFLNIHPEYTVDMNAQRMLFTQHPFGWLKKANK